MTLAWFKSVNWRAAALLGLITSTFSTIAATLAAMRLGRDPIVDWMIVATIPARDGVLQVHPTLPVILGGIAFHQWADFSWTIVFFGLLGRWTAGLKPQMILVIAPFWALLTSSLEWLFLVPILPFWQPIFTLEQAYWLGFAVHLTSASMYPLFPWVRDKVAGVRPSPHRRFAAGWSGAALAGVAVLAVLFAFGLAKREPPFMGRQPAYDQAFMRRMAAHHAQGVELALIGAEKAQDPHLRALARMMAAAQTSENKIFDSWWRSWFGGRLPPISMAEHMAMPGMLTPAEMARVRATGGPAFDPLFVELMSRHHRGAIGMANADLASPGDPRVKIMAHAIRHEQTGEIALMHKVKPGPEVLRIALTSLFAPPSSDGWPNPMPQ